MDLRAWMADRSRWGDLLDLINQLPGATRFQAALLDHPQAAEQILAAQDEQATRAPSVAEWSVDVAINAGVYDRLGVLIDLISSAFGDRSTSTPMARPYTLVDRLREAARLQAAEELIALFGGRPTR